MQYRFAAHLRDPRRHAAPPGIELRRLKIYTELFYNNVEGFLGNAFPVLKRITPPARWHALVRDFYAQHVSHEPLFHGIAGEFVRYLREERRPAPGDWPFLRELAHYEWVELALGVAATPLPRARVTGNLLRGVPVLSPLAWPLQYSYPVHRIGPEFLPARPGPQPTCLIVWRNREDHVKFMEANAVTLRVLQLLRGGRLTGAQALARVARTLRHPQPQQVVAEGAQLLDALRLRGILLGTQPARRGRRG